MGMPSGGWCSEMDAKAVTKKVKQDRTNLQDIIDRITSEHQDKVYVAKGYTKADLIRDLQHVNFVNILSRGQFSPYR